MISQYVILRVMLESRPAEPFSLGDPWAPASMVPHPAAVPGVQATLERAELTRSEVLDTANDLSVRGLARVMPTAPVQLFDVPSQALAKEAWSIRAVRPPEARLDGGRDRGGAGHRPRRTHGRGPKRRPGVRRGPSGWRAGGGRRPCPWHWGHGDRAGPPANSAPRITAATLQLIGGWVARA